LQPASIDLRLGNRFLIFDKANFSAIDVRKPLDNFMKETSIGGDKPFILHPGEFALGVIHEWVGVGHDMVGRLEGKSSLGRLGLIVHATAGFLDPGNCLHMTLELHNLGNLPIMLYHMMPIAQLAFMPLSSACEIPYGDARRRAGLPSRTTNRATAGARRNGREEGGPAPVAETPIASPATPAMACAHHSRLSVPSRKVATRLS